MAASKVIQLVGRYGDRNNIFDDQGMRSLITSCEAPKDHYTVVSIIGPQSTGKSTLMNGIFGTDFTVMDESKGSGRTTQGIWASICHSPRAVVLDVEGTDGVDNQNDLGFQTRSALFALVISDVTFFNIFVREVDRSNSIPLLTNIFQEIVKQAGAEGLPQGQEKHIVFAVRDYNGKTPKSTLQKIVTSLIINKIWRSIHQGENSKLERYFKLHVELFPHHDYKEPEFIKKCKEITECIAHSDWVDRTLSQLPVCDFTLSAKAMWDKIVNNKTLDIPSHLATWSRASCENIMKKKFEQFVESKYPKLIKPEKDSPKEFDNQLQQIIEDILFDYHNETQVYGHEYAAETKATLKTKILDHAEKGFTTVMKLFQERILVKYRYELQLTREKKQSPDNIEERVNSVVEKYRAEFLRETKGLEFYNNKLNHNHFLDTLQLEGDNKTADIKKTQAENEKAVAEEEKRKAQKALRITKGVLLGVAAAATGIVGVVAAAPVAPFVGATVVIATAVTGGTVAAVSTGAAVAIEAVEAKNNHSPGSAAEASRKLLEVEQKLDATEKGR